MELSVADRPVEKVAIVSVAGEVDLHTAPELREALETQIARDLHGVVVDLGAVTFLDSTGLGALVSGRTAADGRGLALQIVCTSDRVLKLFTITGLDGVFRFFGDVDSAVADAR